MCAKEVAKIFKAGSSRPGLVEIITKEILPKATKIAKEVIKKVVKP